MADTLAQTVENFIANNTAEIRRGKRLLLIYLWVAKKKCR